MQLDADRQHNQEVHGGFAGRMIVRESLPDLNPPWPAPHHVFGDGRLDGLKPEFEQFAVNGWRYPTRVLLVHPPDQKPEVRLDHTEFVSADNAR